MKKLLLALGVSLLATCAFAQPEEVVRPGSVITVRTDERITANRSDGRVYSGSVSEDVVDRDGHVAVPRGARVELLVRQVARNEMVLDLESVDVNGRRYGLRADAEEVQGSNNNAGRTAKAGVGGAILGTIVGAIAGGGKGAAIGAVAGGGAGVGIAFATRGRTVNIPAEYLLSFRLDRPLVIVPAEHGYERDGHHYHR